MLTFADDSSAPDGTYTGADLRRLVEQMGSRPAANQTSRADMTRVVSAMSGDPLNSGDKPDLSPDAHEFGINKKGRALHERGVGFDNATLPLYRLLPQRFQDTAKNTPAASYDLDMAPTAVPSGHYGGRLAENDRLRGLANAPADYGTRTSGDIDVPIAEMASNDAWERGHPSMERPPLGQLPAKTILTSPESSKDAFVVMHEYGHGVWYHDLTPRERAQWNTIHARYAADAEDENSNTPGAMIRYFKPDEGWHSFASVFASYVLDPTALRQKYPDLGSFMDEISRSPQSRKR